MGISVQCEPSREVAQRGERMAEIVEPDLRQARPIQHPVERIKHAVFDELGNSQKETVSFML